MHCFSQTNPMSFAKHGAKAFPFLASMATAHQFNVYRSDDYLW